MATDDGAICDKPRPCVGGAEWQGGRKLGKWGSKNIAGHQDKPSRPGCEIPQNKGKLWGNERGNVDLCWVTWKLRSEKAKSLWQMASLNQMVMVMMMPGRWSSFVGELATVVRCGRRLGKDQQQLALLLWFLIFSFWDKISQQECLIRSHFQKYLPVLAKMSEKKSSCLWMQQKTNCGSNIMNHLKISRNI